MPITKATASSIAPAAKGDLVVGSATNDASVLAVGTNNYILTADSAEATGMKWAAASAGGMTLLASGSLTGASVSASISAGYNDIAIYITNWLPANANASLRYTLNNDTNARYINELNTSTINGSFSETSGRISQGVSSTTSSNNFYLYFPFYTASIFKTNTTLCAGNNNATTANVNYNNWFNIYNQTTAISSIQFFPNSGNHTSGNYSIYGVK